MWAKHSLWALSFTEPSQLWDIMILYIYDTGKGISRENTKFIEVQRWKSISCLAEIILPTSLVLACNSHLKYRRHWELMVKLFTYWINYWVEITRKISELLRISWTIAINTCKICTDLNRIKFIYLLWNSSSEYPWCWWPSWI